MIDISGFSAAVLATRLDAAWSYDRNLGRYRDDKGKFLSQKSVDALIDARVDKLNVTLRKITRMLIRNDITLDQWQESVRQAIKEAHVQAGIIGNGGRNNMGPKEYGQIGQRLRREYGFLQNFAKDLLEKRVSAPMALARVSMYTRAVRGAYLEGYQSKKQEQGYSLMKRTLDPQAKHCQDCLIYARRGIVPIGAVPLPGERCACRSNCKCSVKFFRQQFPSVGV